MLEQLCAQLHNFFERHPVSHERMIYPGEYTIEDGSISLPFLLSGQRFRIKGSALNDGVYTYGAYIMDDDASGKVTLNDESFTGEIWAMYPPKAAVEAAATASAWLAKYGDTFSGPYTSESFGGYSYSKGATSDADGMPSGTWYGVPKSLLNQWRKVHTE